MSYPNIIDDINELEDKNLTLVHLLNYIYPVGSIYMSVNNVSPSTFLGGSWEQIQDTFLLCAGSSYMAGSTGGEATHTLTQAETPAHTHTRGTMEISGVTYVYSYNVDNNSNSVLYQQLSNDNCLSSGSTQGYNYNQLNFKASRNWTGATSSVGGNAAHNNMPPYLAVYVWKRTA